jgi:Leucine-rich repeat (LRR) protein
MQILMDNPSNLQPRSFEELGVFIQALDIWKENELQQNSSNADNINIASDRILQCYINYLPTLDLRGLNILEIPSVLLEFNHLEQLSLRDNRNINLDSLTNLRNLTNLEFLSLRGIGNENVANFIPQTLTSLLTLDLGRNNITQFPTNILQFSTLTSLDLEINMISSMPNEISQLQQLQYLNISENRLEAIPASISSISSLETLEINNNGIYNENQILTRIPIQGLNNLINNSSINIVRDITNFERNSMQLNLNTTFVTNVTKEFIENLIALSEFNNDEKNSTDIQSIGIARETLSTSNSKILSQKLGEILEFYFSDDVCQRPEFTQALKAIKRFTRSSFFNNGSNDFKKQLSREFLGIFWQIFEKKENQYFLFKIKSIAEESLQDCNDRNIYMIFQIKNLSNKLEPTQLKDLSESRNVEGFFNYLSQQIIFFKVIDLASESIKKIRQQNPNFSEDIEIYLNYIRVFNNEFGNKFSLNLPSISSQHYFQDHGDFAVRPEDFLRFNEISIARQEDNFEPLLKLLAESIALDIYHNAEENNSEINEQEFISSLKDKINEIASEYLSDLQTIASENSEEENHDDVMRIISQDLKQLQITTLQQLALEQLTSFKVNQRFTEFLSDDRITEIDQAFKIKYLKSLKENGGARFTEISKQEQKDQIASADVGGLRTSLASLSTDQSSRPQSPLALGESRSLSPERAQRSQLPQ